MAVLAFSTIVTQALTLAAYPALTHLYPPEEFGVFGIVTTFAVFVGAIVCARIDTVVQIEGHRTEIHLVRLSIAVGLVASCIGGAMSFLIISSDLLPTWGAPADEAASLAISLAAISFFNGYFAVVRQFQVKHSRYGLVAWSQLTRVAVAIPVQVILGLWVGSYWGLLAGFGSGLALSAIIVTPWNAVIGSRYFRSFSIGLRVLRRNRSLIAIDSVNVLVSTSTASIQLFMIAGLYGTTIAGLFVVASRLLFAPVEALGGALSTVYFQRLSQGVRDRATLSPLFLQFLLAATILIAVMVGGAVLLLGPFVDMLLPAAWGDVSSIGIALLPSLAAKMLVSAVGYTALPLRRPQLIMGWNGYQVLSLCVAFAVATWRVMEVTVFIQLFGALLLIGVVVYLAVLRVAIRREETRMQ